MTVVSCGILIVNPASELLLCHATGTARWDVPKGVGEPGETAQQTALRETAEETGLALAPEQLLDLGRHAYRRGKDLHLYAALIERIDPRTCVCRSQFRDARGRLRPEMDAFEWVPFGEAPQRCAKSMAALLTTSSVWLPQVLQRLRGDARAGAAIPSAGP